MADRGTVECSGGGSGRSLAKISTVELNLVSHSSAGCVDNGSGAAVYVKDAGGGKVFLNGEGVSVEFIPGTTAPDASWDCYISTENGTVFASTAAGSETAPVIVAPETDSTSHRPFPINGYIKVLAQNCGNSKNMKVLIHLK